ncbi:MAG: hypothetical protein IH827_10500, partial [Myxococcales bacterium]|nr:hypothetical protein [Myxococcales bacterium]
PVPTVSGTDYFQNFYSAPAGALVHGDVWLAWGAAERRSLQFEGISNNDGENNRLYVVGDADPYELVGLGMLDESALVDATAYPGGVSNTNGFYIRGADGEKFVTNVEIFSGNVIAATFTPNADPDPCVAKGDGALYVFDIETGEGHFEDGSSNPERSLSLGPGLPTDPKISIGVGGKDNKVVIEKSGADIEIIDQDNIDLNGATLYWREND